MEHDVDAVVIGVGSGGTLTGLGRFFKKVQPNLEMILADPTGSILYEWVKTGKLEEAGSWAVEGIGEDFIPDIADMSLVTDAFEIDDRKASPSRASSCARKEFWAAHRPARSSPARSAIAGNRRKRSGSSPSSATPATNISRRCSTIFGWRNRDSSSVRRRAI